MQNQKKKALLLCLVNLDRRSAAPSTPLPVNKTGCTVSLRPVTARCLASRSLLFSATRWLSFPRAESSLSAFSNGAPTPRRTYLSE